MKRFVIVLFALLVGVSAFADTLRLTDGTVVKGTIVSQDATKVVIDSDLGRMEIPRYKVANMDFGNSATPAAAAPAAPAATPNIIINQNVSQNASGGGGNGDNGAISEKERKQAVIKIEQMVRSKAFLNKKKQKVMADTAALLPYEYRALLLDKHKIHGSFGYGLLNLIPSLGSFMQGDIAGGIITWVVIGGGTAIAMVGNNQGALGITGSVIQTAGYVWNLFRPGGYEKYYNKSLREGLATYYSQLPSLDMPLMASEDSVIQVPVVSFEF